MRAEPKGSENSNIVLFGITNIEMGTTESVYISSQP